MFQILIGSAIASGALTTMALSIVGIRQERAKARMIARINAYGRSV